MKNIRFPVVTALIVGALLGFIAASKNVKPEADANAADSTKALSKEQATKSTPKNVSQQVAQLPATATLTAATSAVGANGKKPNILVIWGDDIGYWNVSAYNQGMMGYKTPNIDRIAKEGALFTDAYAQQSCTAGRSAFITGQSPIRTGLLKVGLPGAKQGLFAEDPTIAELLKPHGYATAQIGKNHLGDRNEFLPTVHGFDEFFGNLYHLNAEEEAENSDYPKNPEFHAKFGTRGVLDCKASDKDDPTEDPRFGRIGKQVITDTGPLTKKRMETVESELLARSLDFIDRSVKRSKPFFLWHSTTRMHNWTHLNKDYANKTGLGLYPDGMMEHDRTVGELLKKLDDLGIADNTIVVYSSDNGAQKMTWPDGGQSPFRGEKGTWWEGGFRVPKVVRWPGVIKPGTVINDIISHEDWLPTLLAAAGDADVKKKLLNGMRAGNMTYKVHLDGYNFLPYFKGEVPEGPRKEFFYFADYGTLEALRYGKWKIHFRLAPENIFDRGTTEKVFPQLVNLRSDPFETGIDAMAYKEWMFERVFALVPAQAYVSQFLTTFREFPPRQKGGSFGMDQVMKQLMNSKQN
jgi:arylsulfatase